MKSNREQANYPPGRSGLYQTLLQEKEALVTMFLSSATHIELTQQINRIDELCSKIDKQRKNPSL